jgi:hypothetical protein
MALSAPILSGLMLGQFAGKGLVGINIPGFCSAFSDALISSFLSTNQVTTNDVGLISTGAGIGKMSGLSPDILSSLTYAQCLGNGLRGTGTQPMCDAVSKAVCSHLLSMNSVNTTSMGVAVGTGVGKLSGLIPDTMSVIMIGKLASAGIIGKDIHSFTSAFARGFSSHLMSAAIINVTITGVPSPLAAGSPIPGAGVGIGKVT